jgi:hypothetical protein
MSDLIWKIRYNNNHILRNLDYVQDIYQKLLRIPHEPLTIEDSFKLREALMGIRVHAEMTADDLVTEEVKAEQKAKKRFFKRK